jgi:hypothetical protein
LTNSPALFINEILTDGGKMQFFNWRLRVYKWGILTKRVSICWMDMWKNKLCLEVIVCNKTIINIGGGKRW